MVVNRMKQRGRDGDVRHLQYPRAGHMLFPYARPSDVEFPPMPMDLGGTQRRTQQRMPMRGIRW
jgi:hypothetical protein